MTTSSAPAARRAGPVQGLSLLLPVTLSVMGALLVAPIIPQLMQAFAHVPGIEFLAPMVVTMPSLCIALFSPLAGMLGDSVGRRRLLIWSMAIYAAFGVAPFFLRDLWAILATRVVVGVMEAVVMTLSTTLIADLFRGETRDRWLAAQAGTASVSAVLFLMIGGAAGRFGWHGPFLVYLFPLVLMVGVIAFTWEPSRDEAAGEGEGEEAQRPSLSWAGFPWKFMLGVCAVTLFAATMFYTVQIQLSTALFALGVKDPARIGLLTAIASLAVPLGTLSFWILSPRLPLRGLMLLEFALLGVGFILMSHAPNETTFVAASALNQIGGGMILPTMLTWATRGLPFAVRARGMGVWQSTFALGQFVCGLLVPLIGKSVGGILPTFQVIGAASLVAAVLTLVAMLAAKGGKPQSIAQVSL
ncbi:MFS transporter [Caulobacter sp. D5]|uniref:MFS transporter n=1 Tax=Caulobacter sp. D5 TaxID=357400 RepID=UPI0011B35DE7|nr:MFS transporter [Caulobacter sp. D5]